MFKLLCYHCIMVIIMRVIRDKAIHSDPCIVVT